MIKPKSAEYFYSDYDTYLGEIAGAMRIKLGFLVLTRRNML